MKSVVNFMPRAALRGVLGLAILMLASCSGAHKVHGKVHFSDGTPLTAGRVIAEKEGSSRGASGVISPDGTFRLGITRPDSGLPAGTWDVYIMDAIIQPAGSGTAPTTEPTIQLIHKRFSKKATAQLSFKVPDQVEWDITVQKP
jgi:hypothetical protein